MSKTDWADVLAWAKAEDAKALVALAVPCTDIIATEALRARIAVLRELRNIKNKPVAAEIPEPVPYD